MERGYYSYHGKDREKTLNMVKEEIRLMKNGKYTVPMHYNDGDREVAAYISFPKESTLVVIDDLIKDINKHLYRPIHISSERGTFILGTDDFVEVY